MNKKFLATTFTLTGTIIGAGILGLPYVFSQSGFFIGVFWLIFLGILMTSIHLYLGEVTLRTKKNHQLYGLSKKYLGREGQVLMMFALFVGIYSALIAYLIGEGQSLSQLFTGSTEYSLVFAFVFWIVMSSLLSEGLRGLKNVEMFGVSVIIVIILSLFVIYFNGMSLENLNYVDYSSFFIPLGVVIFALGGFASIPELKKEILGSEKKLRKAIILGSLIPILLYALFSMIFVGNLGRGVSEVATLSFGPLITLLGIFTMLTSYLVLSFALKDTFNTDLKFKRRYRIFFVQVLPFMLYFFISYFDWFDFVGIMGVGGVLAGGISGMLIMVMNYKAKKLGDRKPEYSIPINWFIVGLVFIIFITAIVLELGF